MSTIFVDLYFPSTIIPSTAYSPNRSLSFCINSTTQATDPTTLAVMLCIGPDYLLKQIKPLYPLTITLQNRVY